MDNTCRVVKWLYNSYILQTVLRLTLTWGQNDVISKFCYVISILANSYLHFENLVYQECCC